jgi:hypothetical protein
MFKFYRNLSRVKKIITIFLSIPVGGIIGFIIGLIATTFIPLCCDDNGCHNCFQFKGLIGYEATSLVGFLIGLFLIPIIYILLIVHSEKRGNL